MDGLLAYMTGLATGIIIYMIFWIFSLQNPVAGALYNKILCSNIKSA